MTLTLLLGRLDFALKSWKSTTHVLELDRELWGQKMNCVLEVDGIQHFKHDFERAERERDLAAEQVLQAENSRPDASTQATDL